MPSDNELRVAFNKALVSEAPNTLGTENDIPTKPTGDYMASPENWQDYVLYFLLPDRFADGKTRPLLNRNNVAAARPAGFRFDDWAKSGADRWQGGTIKGLASKLPYLAQLGVNAVWIAPVLRQRMKVNSYHGYGIQHFLDVDPRLGTRQDLVDLVTTAHAAGIRIILDIVFNHTGCNWWYVVDGTEQRMPAYKSWADCYGPGRWLDAQENRISGAPVSSYDGVLPKELQDWDFYTRAGEGNLGQGDVDWGHAEHKRTDFCGLRDAATDKDWVLSKLMLIYKYWIALSDCDGFRLDTVKHVSKEEARNFCGAIKEYAARLGKHKFLLLGEVAGGDYFEDKYLDACEQNLSSILDIGELKLALIDVAKGFVPPANYFNGFNPNDQGMGSHRYLGSQHVSINEDHDAVMGRKVRFSAEIPDDMACKPYQVAAATCIQLFSLGIPCIYAGTEQALCGPEVSKQPLCPDWGGSDRYLREAMFGPEHPRPDATTHSMEEQLAGADPLPGFGPCGTAGYECFDVHHPAFVRIQAAIALRQKEAVLRFGRQYLRQVKKGDGWWDFPNPGEVIPWSRILDVREALCVVSASGTSKRSAKIIVDWQLNPAGSKFTVLLNTAQAAAGSSYAGPHAVGSTVTVQRPLNEPAFVEIIELPPAETLVLSNGR